MLLPNRKVFFISLIFLLTLVTYHFFPSFIYAANFAVGEDASGFFIKDRTTGNIKLRIDNNGFLSAPMKASNAGSGNNMVFNGGFQTITDTVANIPDGWTTGYVTTACTVSSQCSYAVNTSNYYGGSQSMALTNTTGNTGIVSIASAPFTVVPGQTYTGYVHLFTNNSAVSNLNVTIIFFPGSVADTSTTYGNRTVLADQTIYTGASYNSGTGWDTATANSTFTVSTTACGISVPCAKARMIIYFNSSTATQTLYVQNATVTSGQSVNSAVNASYISSGAFGSNTGLGNYSFPGNVGIGTTGPDEKLDVWSSGASKIKAETSGADSNSVELLLHSTANNANWSIGSNKSSVGGASDNLFIYKSAGTIGTKFIINDSGNVGIGTTGPAYKLDVQGGDINVANNLREGGSALSGKYAYVGGGNATGTWGIGISGNAATVTNGLYTTSTIANAINNGNFYAPTTGNVGIGTTGPLSKIHVQGASNGLVAGNLSATDVMTIEGVDGALELVGQNAGNWATAINFAEVNSGILAYKWSIAGGATGSSLYANKLTFNYGTNANFYSNSVMMTLDSSGNVGIGTTGPVAKLDVAGSINISLDNSLLWGATGWGIKEPSATRNLDFSYGGTNLLSVTNGGNVGIGTASPRGTLDVNGTSYNSSGSWSGSDIRWKKNILPLEDSLAKVGKLQGVSFLWNQTDYPDKHFVDGPQIGLIAQDVEKIVPEVVSTGPDGYKSLSYEKLTAVLIEAVKDQQKQIDDLKSQIQELRNGK